jgi:hypothetical protein
VVPENFTAVISDDEAIITTLIPELNSADYFSRRDTDKIGPTDRVSMATRLFI